MFALAFLDPYLEPDEISLAGGYTVRLTSAVRSSARPLRSATGDIRWRYSAPSSIHGSPTILAGLLYFSTCGQCGHRGSRPAKLGPNGTYALDAHTGKLVWSFPDGKYSPLVADSQRIYLAGKARLYALAPCQRHPARKKQTQQRAC